MRKVIFDKDNESRPYTAVNGVFFKKISNKTHILLGKRKNVSGSGYYYLPGGHIRDGERIERALVREIKEECGLTVKQGRLLWVEESLTRRHHIVLYYEAIINGNSEPKNLEPDKCSGWQWFALDNLPQPLWHTLQQFITEYINRKRIYRLATPSIDYIGVGVAAVILDDKNQVLLQKRGKKAKNEVGKWKLPGGQIEYGENSVRALKRELKEELDVEVEIKKQIFCLDDIIIDEGQHWLTPFYLCQIIKGKPRNMEKDKTETIKWFSLTDLPDDLAYGTGEVLAKIS